VAAARAGSAGGRRGRDRREERLDGGEGPAVAPLRARGPAALQCRAAVVGVAVVGVGTGGQRVPAAPASTSTLETSASP
jgi:hypothetical protein